MNRFSAREFALLCLPVIFIAGAGLWVATRPAPEPLHLEFHVERPTTLEAFKGADTVWITQIRGDDAENVRMDSSQTEPFAELQTANKTQIASSRSWSGSSPWGNVWKLPQSYHKDNLRLPVNAMAIPDGQLYLNLKTRPIVRNPAPGTAPTPMAPLEGKWPVDRTQFAPFDFKAMARESLVRVRSVVVVSAHPSWIQGETTFDLTGAGMNAQTPVDFDLSNHVPYKGGMMMGSYDSQATVDPTDARRRIVKWNLPGPAPAPPQLVGNLSGRISADERWPLAFQVEPVDFAKAKAGQNLKFTQRPAPIPKP